MTALPEPAHRLPAAARTMWRVQLGGAALVAAAIVSTAFGLAGLLVLVAGVVVAAVVPEVRWRRWRYEVRPEEIDLRHGTFTVRRTLVPIRRVQHVDTRTGVLQGLFGLATVSFHTAAGRTEVPALPTGEAESVRRRVGELARTRDDT